MLSKHFCSFGSAGDALKGPTSTRLNKFISNQSEVLLTLVQPYLLKNIHFK